MEDLFGAPAEERECGESVAKIPESKSPQSHNTYEIVSRYLSPKLLPDLLLPVKEVQMIVYSNAHMYFMVHNGIYGLW